MGVTWTAGNFTYYVLVYLNKYLSGSIYLNFYIDGVVAIIALSIGKEVYGRLKHRLAYVVSYSITLFGAIGLVLFLGRFVSPDFVQSLGAPSSGYPKGSEEDRQHNLRFVVPVFTFIAKAGCAITL